jgi:hypothetical protein
MREVSSIFDNAQNRPYVLNEEILQRDYGVQESNSNNTLNDLGHYMKKKYTPNRKNIVHWFLNFFPIIQWLPKYKFKEYFLKDLIGGVTLGIVLIPQTMGYSLNGVKYFLKMMQII